MNYRVALLLKNIFSLKPKSIYDYFIRGEPKDLITTQRLAQCGNHTDVHTHKISANNIESPRGAGVGGGGRDQWIYYLLRGSLHCRHGRVRARNPGG